MKLAEALLIRADLQNKIGELEMRLINNATVQEGELPAEDPQELLHQLDRAVDELERLIALINLTNAKIEANGKTMTELLAKRDCMKRRLSVLREFLDNAGALSKRARASEIKIKSTIPVAELQKHVDRQAAELRRLELDIQSLNWLSELSE